MTNNTTRKHPRTLQEAFGPYAGRTVHAPTEPGYPLTWWAAIVSIAAAALVVIYLTR